MIPFRSNTRRWTKFVGNFTLCICIYVLISLNNLLKTYVMLRFLIKEGIISIQHFIQSRKFLFNVGVRRVAGMSSSSHCCTTILNVANRLLSTFPLENSTIIPKILLSPTLLENSKMLSATPSTVTQIRSVTKFSLVKGKRKSVKAVLRRFKRLDWGAWIRTRCGRHKKLFRKSPALKRRLRQHVFTNATQSWLLDKMVTSFWRRPKYYIDDPYEPYHTRDEYFAAKKKTFKV